MNVTISQTAIPSIANFVSYMKGLKYDMQTLTNYKNAMISNLPSIIQSAIANGIQDGNRGYCCYRIPNNPNIWAFGFIYYPKYSTAMITGIFLRRAVQENKESHESSKNRNIVTLTESQLKSYIKDAAVEILKEGFNFPKNLSKAEATDRFLYLLSDLYLNGKITMDEHDQLSFYATWYGFNHDIHFKNKKT